MPDNYATGTSGLFSCNYQLRAVAVRIRLRSPIIQIHGLLDALVQPRLHRSGELRHQRENIAPLIARERRQHEIGEILVYPLPLFARTYTDAKAPVLLRSERVLDTLEAVVSARASTWSDPDAPDRQLHFVYND